MFWSYQYPFPDLLNRSLLVKSLNDYFGIAVTTTKENVFGFGTGNPSWQVSIDSILVDSWVNYFDNCITLDFLKNETIKEEGIRDIYVDFYDKYNASLMSVEIIPLDRNLFTERTLKNTRLYYFGPNIVMEKGVFTGAYDDYILELRQDRYVEHDPSKNCKNYPNKEYESYNACDKNFTLTTLAEHYGPEFVPFWATDNLDNVTKSHPVDWSYDYGPLYDGTIMSDCPLPCTTNSVNARFINRKKVGTTF